MAIEEKFSRNESEYFTRLDADLMQEFDRSESRFFGSLLGFRR